MRMDTKTELIGGGTIAVIALGVAGYFIFKKKFETTADNVNNAVGGATDLVRTTTDETGQSIKSVLDLPQQQLNFLTQASQIYENYLLESLKNKISGYNSIEEQNRRAIEEQNKNPIIQTNAPTQEQAISVQKSTEVLKSFGFVPKGLPMSISGDNAKSNILAQQALQNAKKTGQDVLTYTKDSTGKRIYKKIN